ncbi:hemicentin-2-like [Branchiostoma floridae]|uniref:Hemicentin-2-like n=1 Tax=Branchiostoma floridae TaxID=7739 RepID=A0A9J7MZL2_BRAFL|nr:hemicentin-2-like [Branchiostoma floridae]
MLKDWKTKRERFGGRREKGLYSRAFRAFKMADVSGASSSLSVWISCFTLIAMAESALYRVFPESAAVLVGHNVTMNCAFSGLSASDVVNWHKYNPSEPDGKPFHVSSGSVVDPEFPRFSIVGNNRSGEFNLRVTNAQPADAGNYRCGVFSFTDTRDARLTVVVPPPSSPVVLGDLSPRAAGKSLILSCRSEGGDPLPTLAWYNGTQRLDLPREAMVEQAVRRISLDLVISFLTKWDNGANFSCESDQGFPFLTDPLVTSVTIQVRYPPVVKVPKMSVVVTEGQSANLSCEVDSNPRASLTWWRLGDSSPQGPLGRGSVLTLTNVTSFDLGTYQCTARNGVKPDGFGTMALDVRFPPLIKSVFDEETTVMYGQAGFSLNCQAEGNPKPRVRWRRIGTRVFYENPLAFSEIGYANEGAYECVANSKGFQAVSRSTFINVVGRPEVLNVSSTVSVTRGEPVSLTCLIRSDPTPDKITWLWRGRSGQRDFDDKSKGDVDVKTVYGDKIQSKLTISSATKDLAGTYMCKATNKFGSDLREFRLTVSVSRVAVVGVIAGSAAVGMLLAVAAIITLSIRRGWIRRDRKEKKSSKSESIAYCITRGSANKKKKNGSPTKRSAIELQHFEKPTIHSSPARRDRNTYSIDLLHSSDVERKIDYPSNEKEQFYEEDICLQHSPYRTGRQTKLDFTNRRC